MKGKKRKKLLLSLAILLLAGSFITAALVATLDISGTIASTTSISIDSGTAALGEFTDTAVVDSLIATITETSNSATGYTVTMVTTNGTTTGLLNGPGGDSIAYTIKYEDVAATFVTSSVVVTDVANSDLSPDTKTVKISYDIADVAALSTGSYTDTLTFTIAAQ